MCVCVCVCVGCSIAPVLEIIAYVDYVPAAARSPELLRRRAVPRQNLYRWHALLRRLRLAKLDHEDGARAWGTPQDLGS